MGPRYGFRVDRRGTEPRRPVESAKAPPLSTARCFLAQSSWSVCGPGSGIPGKPRRYPLSAAAMAHRLPPIEQARPIRSAVQTACRTRRGFCPFDSVWRQSFGGHPKTLRLTADVHAIVQRPRPAGHRSSLRAQHATGPHRAHRRPGPEASKLGQLEEDSSQSQFCGRRVAASGLAWRWSPPRVPVGGENIHRLSRARSLAALTPATGYKILQKTDRASG